jgi:hypothetical protein
MPLNQDAGLTHMEREGRRETWDRKHLRQHHHFKKVQPGQWGILRLKTFTASDQNEPVVVVCALSLAGSNLYRAWP